MNTQSQSINAIDSTDVTDAANSNVAQPPVRLNAQQKFLALAQKIEELFETGKFVLPFGAAKPHSNFSTGKRYNGINAMVLSLVADERGFTSRKWMTHKQLSDLGYFIKRGDSGTPVEFWSQIEKKNDSSQDEDKSMRWFVRYYTVFNLNQCIDSSGNQVVVSETSTLPDLEEQQNICYTIAERMGVTIFHQHECGQAYYSPSQKLIKMPMPEDFTSQVDYISTLLHELGHATHPHVRPNWEKGMFGSVPYAKEEVVAELTSVFASSMFGIDKIPLESHASYINGWLKASKDNTKTFFNIALKESTKAAYFMWDLMYPEDQSTTEVPVSQEPKAETTTKPKAKTTKPKAKTTKPKAKTTKPKATKQEINALMP